MCQCNHTLAFGPSTNGVAEAFRDPSPIVRRNERRNPQTLDRCVLVKHDRS